MSEVSKHMSSDKSHDKDPGPNNQQMLNKFWSIVRSWMLALLPIAPLVIVLLAAVFIYSLPADGSLANMFSDNIWDVLAVLTVIALPVVEQIGNLQEVADRSDGVGDFPGKVHFACVSLLLGCLIAVQYAFALLMFILWKAPVTGTKDYGAANLVGGILLAVIVS